jgi:hypothetical protein
VVKDCERGNVGPTQTSVRVKENGAHAGMRKTCIRTASARVKETARAGMQKNLHPRPRQRNGARAGMSAETQRANARQTTHTTSTPQRKRKPATHRELDSYIEENRRRQAEKTK